MNGKHWCRFCNYKNGLLSTNGPSTINAAFITCYLLFIIAFNGGNGPFMQCMSEIYPDLSVSDTKTLMKYNKHFILIK